MSVDAFYNIEFKTPPSEERLADIRYKLVDVMGVSGFFCDSASGEDILVPVERKGSELVKVWGSDLSSSIYQVLPMTPDYRADYECGNFFEHYYIVRFFLAQEDVNAVFKSYESDEIGKEVTLNDAEALLKRFIDSGYFQYNKVNSSFDLPVEIIHPECWCKKPMRRTSNDNENINYVCAAENCRMPPVRITGNVAKDLINKGIIPSKYHKIKDSEGFIFYQAKNKSLINLAFSTFKR